jgi:hypothetical protein
MEEFVELQGGMVVCWKYQLQWDIEKMVFSEWVPSVVLLFN